MNGWEPATATERAMLAAGDRSALLAALVTGPLLMPVSPAAAAGLEPAGWATGVHDGVTHVLAFTSPAAIAACLPGQSVQYRTDSLPSLVANWPDPGWVLAIDLGLPVGLLLGVDELTALPDLTVPGEEPLRAAIEARDPDLVTAALLRAELILPIRPDAPPTRDLADPEFPWPLLPDGIRVYTSEQRLHQALGEADWIAVSSPQLTTHWPDPARPLLLNAGTPLAVEVAGTTVRELGEWLSEVRSALSEPRLQLVIPPMYVAAYLEQGYDRAAGLVHAWTAGDTPHGLYERLGLLGEGSPFQADDDWAVVLRWDPDDTTPAAWAVGEPRMESVVVPDGAGLHRLTPDGGDVLVAVFDAADRKWAPPA